MAKNKETGLGGFLVMVILSTICLGISCYQMTISYKDFTNNNYWISFGISLALVIMLGFIAHQMYKAKRANQPVMKFAISFLVIAILVSFVGNFNVIYTYFMQNEILKKELSQKIDSFNKCLGSKSSAV
jgi:hypothetical protein